MKKILLTTVAIATLSSTTFAGDLIDNQIYLRGDLGGAYFTKFTTKGVKIKPKFGTAIDVGVGYHVMDNLRVELVYNHPFASSMKGSDKVNTVIPAVLVVDTMYPDKIEVKHKPNIHALFARVAGDVIDLGMGKIFITGGLGWARVKDSITATFTGVVGVAGPALPVAAKPAVVSETIKAKNKNNLAWTIGTGASFDVAEGVHLDVAYSYRDYGKSKAIKSSKAVHYKAHIVTVGARFDI